MGPGTPTGRSKSRRAFPTLSLANSVHALPQSCRSLPQITRQSLLVDAEGFCRFEGRSELPRGHELRKLLFVLSTLFLLRFTDA